MLDPSLQRAKRRRERGNLDLAGLLSREIVARKPEFFDALHNLGILHFQQGRLSEALLCLRAALDDNPGNISALLNYGLVLAACGRLEEALANCDKALALKPTFAPALINRGNALKRLNCPAEALASFDQALAVAPDYVEAHNNRGNVLRDLSRPAEAVASFDRAIALKPDYVEALYNKGCALTELRRPDEALASFDDALRLRSRLPEALNNRGVVLADVGRFDEALESCDAALALRPNYAEAHNNRGNILRGFRRFEEALSSHSRAVEIAPDHAEAHANRGDVLIELKRFEEAIQSYERALELKPDTNFLRGKLFQARMKICEWRDYETRSVEILARASRGEKAMHPFPLLALSNDPSLLKTSSTLWFSEKQAPAIDRPIRPRHDQNGKIRLGYFSADFRRHAVASLIVDLFEIHDRSKFDLTAFSLGPDTDDPLRRRMKNAFDRFIDVRAESDKSVATTARNIGIDIAIDLNGFTEFARTRIFAMRAAPIQVNFLGYPGTMGSSCIDYIIADPILISERDHRHYAEKVVCLPNSYQPNDRKREISNRQFERVEAGLPEEGFVFCCFNNNYKIGPRQFDIWMRILKAVDGSVLWLFEDNASASSNLRSEAALRGVNPDRIVFGSALPPADHLARHRLANLFLDTLPYNAHTTASDALWAGLPVLTQAGETFAGRVAASLLSAVGLNELITTTPRDYESLAIDLAKTPDRLAGLRQKLAVHRAVAPLFSTEAYAKHIEAAYTTMCERLRDGLPPDHIHVSL